MPDIFYISLSLAAVAVLIGMVFLTGRPSRISHTMSGGPAGAEPGDYDEV